MSVLWAVPLKLTQMVLNAHYNQKLKLKKKKKKEWKPRLDTVFQLENKVETLWSLQVSFIKECSPEMAA